MSFLIGILLAVDVLCLQACGKCAWRREWREAAKWGGIALAYFVLVTGLVALWVLTDEDPS